VRQCFICASNHLDCSGSMLQSALPCSCYGSRQRAWRLGPSPTRLRPRPLRGRNPPLRHPRMRGRAQEVQSGLSEATRPFVPVQHRQVLQTASQALTAPVSEGDVSGAEQQRRDSSVKRSALPSAAGPTEPTATPAAGLGFSNSSTVPVEPSPTPYYRTWWVWTGVGAVVAAGVITAVVWPKNNGQLSTSGTTLGTRTVLQ